MAGLRGGVEQPTEKELEASYVAQRAVMDRALKVYGERNARYHDGWRRSGWRGTLCDLRRKIERGWSHLWNAEPETNPDIDDLVDIINYAAFTIRAIEEGNRDGTGGWW